jgi:chemotaxis protein MotA
MGILGTVMALIMTLANAGSDPNLLIKNIATAFIATFVGVLSAIFVLAAYWR